MTYNVISYPLAQVDPEVKIVAQAATYWEAVNAVLLDSCLKTHDLLPVHAHAVAALTPYSPLQAWELLVDGDKVALLAIQLDTDEEGSDDDDQA